MSGVFHQASVLCTPPPPPFGAGGKKHSLGGEGAGVNILENCQTLLSTIHM
jgi:hypothetical protein